MKRLVYLVGMITMVLFVTGLLYYKTHNPGFNPLAGPEEAILTDFRNNTSSCPTIDFEKLIKVIEEFPAQAMSEPFEKLTSEAGLSIFDSEDGNIRLYACEYPFIGTMGEYGSLVEYKCGDEFKFIKHLPSDEEPWGMPTALYTLGNNKYILCQYARESSMTATIKAIAFQLTDNGLEEFASFSAEDNSSSRVFWPGEEVEWDYTEFNDSEKVFSFAGNPITGAKCKYKWDGEHFIPLGVE